MGVKLTKEEFIRRANEKNEYVRNGDIEIRGEYITSNKPIECFCKRHNVLCNMSPSNLFRGSGCRKCGIEKRSNARTMSRNDFIEKLTATGNETKLYGDYNGIFTETEFICPSGHIFIDKPSVVLHVNVLCPYCSSKRILIGFNDLWTTRPDVAKLLLDPNDGYKYTYKSNKHIDFLCPYCKTVYKKSIGDVSQYGFSCSKCSDGISYPNKFGRAFLDQLNLDYYITEYSPDWLKPYSYDNYFVYNDIEYILEMDGGLGHGNLDLKSKQKDVDGIRRDLIKDELANNMGITVIRIDAQQSECEYIKNNILNSCLNDIFDLSVIDWKQCDMISRRNIVKEACDLYVLGLSVADIARELKMHKATIIRYLKKGKEFEWCSYDPKQAYIDGVRKHWKPVKVYNIKDNSLYYFDSVAESGRRLSEIYGQKISEDTIRKVLKKGGIYKDFVFTVIDKTIQN